MSETPQTERANFRMIYETLAERERKDAQIPQPLKMLIGQMQSGNLIAYKEENDG